MKSLFCFLALLGSFHIANAQAKAITNEQFARYCCAITSQDASDSNETGFTSSREIRQTAARAKRYLASLSQSQKRQLFVRVERLPLAGGAMQSMAYVAAINDIEPYNHARKMLYGYVPGRDGLWPDFDGPGTNVFGCMLNIYERSHDRRVAMLLLEEAGDGEGGVIAGEMRFLMFERQPHFILGLAMQSRKAFPILADDFVYGEPDTKDFQILRRLCHDPNPILRRGARQIQRRIHA